MSVELRGAARVCSLTMLFPALLGCSADQVDVLWHANAMPLDSTVADGGLDAGGGAGRIEICDGIDNDGNGIIDDVDVQGDGVCDCLNIATIGQIGPWGDGNNVFQNWLDAHGARPATNLGDGEITEQALAPFQIVVLLYASTRQVSNNGQTLHAHHAFSNREVEAFTNWVRKGNGVVSTSGYTSDEASEVANVNKLLAPFGLGYSKTKLSLDGDVTKWMAHPLTDGVSRIHTSVGVEPDGPMAVTLAWDENMHVALQASQGDDSDGHLVVWGDEWITYDSEWKADDQVERFWLNILKWTSPSKVCQVPIAPD